MKNQIKCTLLVAAVGALAISAQAASNNGDLLIGFTSKTGNDLVYDLGQTSNLFDGKTWDLSAELATFSLNTVNWGVIGAIKGAGATGYAWTTTATDDPAPASLASFSDWSALNTPTKSLFNDFNPSGPNGNPTPGSSISIDSTTDNSWNKQTISGSLTTQYVNVYGNPNVVGVTSDNFYSRYSDNSAPTLLGSFSLGGNGTITFNAAPVPEPATYALFTVAGLFALGFRNHLRNKQS